MISKLICKLTKTQIKTKLIFITKIHTQPCFLHALSVRLSFSRFYWLRTDRSYRTCFFPHKFLISEKSGRFYAPTVFLTASRIGWGCCPFTERLQTITRNGDRWGVFCRFLRVLSENQQSKSSVEAKVTPSGNVRRCQLTDVEQTAFAKRKTLVNNDLYIKHKCCYRYRGRATIKHRIC